jgi:hypothetical protein
MVSEGKPVYQPGGLVALGVAEVFRAGQPDGFPGNVRISAKTMLPQP